MSLKLSLKGRNNLSRKVCWVLYAVSKGTSVAEKAGCSLNLVYISITGTRRWKSGAYFKNQIPRLFFDPLNQKP